MLVTFAEVGDGYGLGQGVLEVVAEDVACVVELEVAVLGTEGEQAFVPAFVDVEPVALYFATEGMLLA